MKILIAGSMDATPAMITYAHRCVERAVERGQTVLVGDNPHGVDAAVLEALEAHQHPGIVYSANTMRCTVSTMSISVFVLEIASTGRAAYEQRDRLMCERADAGMFIWNGHSRGTQRGFDYMRSLGKPCWLWKSGHIIKVGKKA